MPVVPFPMPAERALQLIREAACDSGGYSIPNPPAGGEWYRAITRRQVELCLREGDLAEQPRVDERGSVYVSLERFSAGVLVRIGVILWKNENDDWRVTVNSVEQQP